MTVSHLSSFENHHLLLALNSGAFNYGANSVSRYRPVALSLLAKSQGHPIILVQIQYRLGPLGFAAPPSPPPTESALSSRLSNFGLLDQIHALEWIRDHISSFGGNPQNVTAFGVSAGSASIHHHILTSNPLFDRAILMSGSGPTLGPLPTSLYQLAWEKYISSSPKLQELTTDEERLEHARNTDVNELIANYTHAAMSPMADGILLPKEWDYRAVQKETRCKEIIIGDTHIEAIIMDGLISKIPQSKFLSIVKSTIPDASGFLRAFGFSIPTEQEGENAKEMEYTAYRDAMRTFLSVGMFQYPNVLVANKYPGKVYFYHFDEPSPYPGPTFGLAYHGQCALFVYQNGNETYPEGARNTAERMGRIWTGFASGKGPIKGLDDWEEYGVAKRFLRFGPNGGAGMQSLESDEVRQYKWLNWVEGKGNFDSVIELVRKLTLLGP